MGSISYQQAVDALRMIVDRFGVEIYFEEGRLFGLLNDILPNTSKRKNILKTAISLGMPKLLTAVLARA